MSKWGIEEKETLEAIDEINFSGNILDVAAGDGRFANRILKSANSLTAIDISNIDLKILKDNCPNYLVDKLNTLVVDITKVWPFSKAYFDGVFCTGSLHLFNKDTIIYILNEIMRVLKPGGKIILDFATDIKRLDKDNNLIIFDNEVNYTTDEAISFFNTQLKDFNFNIKISSFSEANLDSSTGYRNIYGNFLIISGSKKEG